MAVEQTLVLVKPDAMQRRLAGEIIGRFEARGLTMRAARLVHVDRELAGEHYAEHAEKPFFGELVDFITSSPTLALVLEGEGAIAVVRSTMGGDEPRHVGARDDPRRPRAVDAGQPRPRLGLARVRRARGERSGSAMTDSSRAADALHNRERWDAYADEYQGRHREMLGRPEPRWGMWQIPEAELQILGDVAGKDVLEYGCGAAQWSILLAGLGARPVGMDNSARQLEHARELLAEAGVDFPLVHASAGEAPFDDASFDVVFCDHGAMTFADPYATVPEVARLLRPGGLFAFSHTTPLSQLCWRERRRGHRPGAAPVLLRPAPDRVAGRAAIEFTLPQGDWIRLFRVNGLVVERLHEVQPPEDTDSTYRDAEETAWARRWPMEQIWKVRKRWS